MSGPALPSPRGPASQLLLGALRSPPGTLDGRHPPDVGPGGDADDLQLALYCCYELHYRGFDGVDPGWEWDPGLLHLRGRLERELGGRLLDAVPYGSVRPDELPAAVLDVVNGGGGPSLSAYLEQRGTLDELREFCIHRSAYQLKEADPHSWAIPRLAGRSKSALVAIQADEYGGGRPGETHAELFTATLRALGLDDRYGAYLDRLPATTLATVNLVSFFGLHRRWRGALIGHLAAFEMTSVTPMGRYARTLERHGAGPEGRRFYDEHVIADAHHQVVALGDLVGGIAADEPDLAGDVLLGARALMYVEGRFARDLLDAWAAGRSSLLSGVNRAA